MWSTEICVLPKQLKVTSYIVGTNCYQLGPTPLRSFWLLDAFQVSSVQSLRHVLLFATPWTAARPASLSIINFQACSNSCPSNHWCHSGISLSVNPFSCLQFFLASGSFTVSQFFASGGQSNGVSASASASILPMNIQDWIPLGLTGLISLKSKGLKSLHQCHSSKAPILQSSAFFMVQLSHSYMTTGKAIDLTIWTFVSRVIIYTE